MKKPNNIVAPLVIAGITVGFLASAYKYIFRYKPNQTETTPQSAASNEQQNTPVLDEPIEPSHNEK